MTSPKTRSPESAPAAHLVTIEPAEGGGGQLVGHLGCSGALAFVPNMPGVGFVLAIDVIQAAINHECPLVQPDVDDSPAAWIEP